MTPPRRRARPATAVSTPLPRFCRLRLRLPRQERPAARRSRPAFHAGNEVACRLSHAIAARHYDAGFHDTATLNAFGAAVAASLLSGLDTVGIAHALAFAASAAGGVRHNFGSMGRDFSIPDSPPRRGSWLRISQRAGWAAATTRSAGGRAISRPRPAVWKARSAWARPWVFVSPGVSIKPFPSGALTHPAMTGLLAIRRERGLSAGDVTAIEVRTNPRIRDTLAHHDPGTVMQARFSMEFCLAVALVEGRAGLAEFTEAALTRPDIRAVMERITFGVFDSPGPGFTNMTTLLDIVLRDGSTVSRRVDWARGAAQGADALRGGRRKGAQLRCPCRLAGSARHSADRSGRRAGKPGGHRDAGAAGCDVAPADLPCAGFGGTVMPLRPGRRAHCRRSPIAFEKAFVGTGRAASVAMALAAVYVAGIALFDEGLLRGGAIGARRGHRPDDGAAGAVRHAGATGAARAALWAIDTALLLGFIYCISLFFSVYEDLWDGVRMFEPFETAAAGFGVAVIIELTRRTFGWVLAAICLLMLVYAIFGASLPWIFRHGGYALDDILGTVWYSFDGVFGTPTGIVATIVLVFIVFGATLEGTGAAAILLKIATAATASIRGGTAHSAIVASCAVRHDLRLHRRQRRGHRGLHDPDDQAPGLSQHLRRCGRGRGFQRWPVHPRRSWPRWSF